MKKDKYGTVTTPSRKSPHGYGLCGTCSHPNVFINERGQIDEHGSTTLGERCPGSLSTPLNVGGKSIFLLVTQMSSNPSRPIWQDRFCFLAPTVKQAEADARSWFRYHGMHYEKDDVLLQIMSPGQASSEDLHDDWIPR